MSIANGIYFDGQTARGRAVTIEFVEPAVLRIAGENLTQEFDLARLRVSDRLGDVPRFLYLPDGAVIETPDNAIVDAALGERQQSRGSRLIHALESQKQIAVAACFVLLAAIAVIGYFGPPALARVVAQRVPKEIDQRIGTASRTAINPYFRTSVLTRQERTRVETQLDRLLEKRPAAPRPRLEFLSMNGGLPNAFALPGNVIVVTDELVRLPASDDELAAVLAHELGHLEKRHGLQSLLRGSFAVLIVAAVTGDLSALTSFAATIPLTILTAGYSRDLEREADRYALELLRARGIPPRAFATALAKLDAAYASLQRNSTYVSTHPSSDERMALFGGMSAVERAEWVHFDRARTLNGAREFGGALKEFALVTTPASQTADFFLERGIAHQGSGKLDAAIADFDRAFAKGLEGPALERAHLTRGNAFLDRNDLPAAIRDYDAVIAANANLGIAYFRRAQAHRRTGEATLCLADLDQAARAGVPEPSILDQRAHLEWDLGHPVEAIRDFDAALAKQNDPNMLRGRAMVRFGLEKWKEAETDLDAALVTRKNVDGEYAHLFRLLARRHQKVDDQKKVFAATVAKWSDGWAKSVGRYLAGEMTEAQLLAEAEKGETPTPIERKCEAYFYTAEMHLFAGDRATAEALYRKCVGTDIRYYYEYNLARAELGQLDPQPMPLPAPRPAEPRPALLGSALARALKAAPAEGDATPRPLFQIRPEYPEAMKLGRIEGEVMVDFLVDTNGEVINAFVVRSSRSEFEAAALAAVRAWKFQPGRKNSLPVISHMQVPIVFTLDETPAPPTGKPLPSKK